MEPFIGQIMLFGGNFAPRGWAQCNGQLLSIAQNNILFSILGTMDGGDGRTTFALPDLRGRVPLGMGQGPGLSNQEQGEKAGVENVTLTPNEIPSHQHPISPTGLHVNLNSAATGTVTAQAAFPATSAPVTGGVAIPVNTAGGINTSVKDPSLGVLGTTGTAIYSSGPTSGKIYSGNAIPVTNGTASIPATNVPVSGSVSVPINATAPVTGSAVTTAVGGSQPHYNMQPYLAMNYCIALEGIFPSRS